MPYKNDHMTFVQNKEKVAKDLITEYTEDLMLSLNMDKKPVGVKFINTKEDYDLLSIKEPKKALAYCQMIAYARNGKMIKSRNENHLCDGATTALGLEPSNAKIESGEEYFSYNLFQCKAAARRLRSNIESLNYEDTKTYGILLGPLDKFENTPDVVIMIANPYQVMRIVQGYEYKTGQKTKMDVGAMQAMCSELTVVPTLTGEINISVLCPSTRMLCRWKEEDMGVSIPFEKFYETVDGVFGTLSTTESKYNKIKIIERFEAVGKKLDIDPNMGY